MPYISAEEVKKIRKQIKEEFPEYKFSIVKQHNMAINLTILSGPLPLIDNNQKYEDVNHFYIDDHYEYFPQKRDLLKRIYIIMTKDNYIESIDSDYGAIPKYYIHMSIGQWDKPYKWLR